MNQFLLFLDLIRIKQWYKNAIIFLALIFGSEPLSFYNISITIFGFFLLSIVTSSGYIRNDLIDFEKDKVHPIKKNRPLTSGYIKKKNAYLLFLIMAIVGLSISISLNVWFGMLLSILLLNTELYSRYIKNKIFLDVFSIGINFVIRAMAGVFLIKSPEFSPWIVFGIFFVAMFLGFIKRKSELLTLDSFAPEHRHVLKKYNLKNLKFALLITSVMIITIYSVYAILGPHNGVLIFTIPFSIVLLLRMLYLSNINHKNLQSNEFFKDKITLIILITYTITTIYLLRINDELLFPNI